MSCGELLLPLPQLAAARVDPHVTVAIDRNSSPIIGKGHFPSFQLLLS